MQWLGRLGAMTLVLVSAHFVEARVIDRVVAVVNDEVVTWSELEDSLAPVLRQVDAIDDPVVRAKQRDTQLKRGLDELVSQRLISQEANRRQIKIEVQDVDEYIERIKKSRSWDEAELSRYLLAQGIDLPEFRRQVRTQLLRQEVVRAVVGSKVRISEGDLKDYYKEKLTQAQTEYEVEASQLLLLVPEGASAADEAAIRLRAVELLARANGGENFAELVRKHGEGDGAAEGGGLGMLRRGTIDSALEDALFSLNEGQVGGPVRTSLGYHLVHAGARKSLPTPSYEEMEDELRRELTDRRLADELTKWLDALKRKAFIEVRL